MASDTAGNPYNNYQEREIEQDLIDPNDREYAVWIKLQLVFDLAPNSKSQ